MHAENFSRDYVIVQDAEVHAWPDSEAIMDEEMYAALARSFGEPIVGCVEGTHYHFRSERRGVPGMSAVVPERNHEGAEPEALLIQK